MNPEYQSIQELWSKYGMDELIHQYLSSSDGASVLSDNGYTTYTMGEYSVDLSKLYQTMQDSSTSRGTKLMDIKHFKYDEESNILTRTIDIRSVMQQYSSEEAALDSVMEKSLQIMNKETETTVPFQWQSLCKDPLGVEYVAVYTIPGGNYYNWKLAKDGKALKVEIRYRCTNLNI
jgi:hypothetical protein